jgi:hypothetical protein
LHFGAQQSPIKDVRLRSIVSGGYMHLTRGSMPATLPGRNGPCTGKCA